MDVKEIERIFNSKIHSVERDHRRQMRILWAVTAPVWLPVCMASMTVGMVFAVVRAGFFAGIKTVHAIRMCIPHDPNLDA